MKLGEALVTDLITQEQLKEALERQVILRRIGTNLVELGFIKEEDIMAFFGKFFRTPTVKPEFWKRSIPRPASIDKEVAEKYMMVPFRRDRSNYMCMLDPDRLMS